MPRHVKPQPGDYFEVALQSKELPAPAQPSACGQVLSVEPDAMDSVACAFWPEYKTDIGAVLASTPISVQLVTPELLRRRVWPIRGNAQVLVPAKLRSYEQYRAHGWVGAKIRGSSGIRELLLAYRGLSAWDDFNDPHYLDSLLLAGQKAPLTARYKRAGA